MPQRGTVTGISGRKVFFLPDGAGKDEQPQIVRFEDQDSPMRILREQGTRKLTHGTDQSEVELPNYVPAHAADLRAGTAVKLMGPPNAGLHSIVILEDQPTAKAGKPAAKAGAHAPAKTPAPGISDDLDQMTAEELRETARAEEVNLHGASTKDEMAAQIKKARRQNKTR